MTEPFLIDTPHNRKAFYHIDPETGCWIWEGTVGHKGHGRINLSGHVLTAHRVYWEWAMGRAVQDGCLLHHNCHNPRCVNPDHLREMTMKEHKRHHLDPRRQLTQEQADEIRHLRFLGLTQPALAAKFHVSRATIRDILAGRTYQ